MEFSGEKITDKGLRYFMRYPANYKEGEKYPTILFFTGAGSIGKSCEDVHGNPFYVITGKKYPDFPFLCFTPLCEAGHVWFDDFEKVLSFAEEIAQNPAVDAERFYVMGASMGGYATWQLGMSRPELFAAIVPVCGGGMSWYAFRLKNTPVWAFHGQLDETVFPEESKRMVDSIRKRGGDAKLTIYPENAHDAWSDTYANPEVFRWLLSHARRDGKIVEMAFDQTAFG